ncbi:MAG: hypothetical protein F4X11_26315 [Acidobacteria bacterium]|nr:hypothetical protein [Acidobacteriota bacterium]
MAGFDPSIEGVAGRRTSVIKTPAAESGQVVVERFGDEITLKRFVRLDVRRVELRPESYNPEHEVMTLDLPKHILNIDGVGGGAMTGAFQDMVSRGNLLAEAEIETTGVHRRVGRRPQARQPHANRHTFPIEAASDLAEPKRSQRRSAA